MTVTYELNNGVATITMDDGKRNALSPEMFAQLGSALGRAEADGAAVLLTGREGTFSAGFDLGVMRAGGAPAVEMMLAGFRMGARLLAFPRPVIVASTGHTIAMGAFLCLSADYRIGTAGDFKIGANEVTIGLTMPWFGIEVCRARLTPTYFQRVITGGELFGPEEALRAGFFDEVLSAEAVNAKAHEVAERLAGVSVDAHVQSKLRAREGMLRAVEEGIAKEESLFRAFLDERCRN